MNEQNFSHYSYWLSALTSLAPLKQVVIVQYDFDLKAYECLVSLKHFSAFEAGSDN